MKNENYQYSPEEIDELRENERRHQFAFEDILRQVPQFSFENYFCHEYPEPKYPSEKSARKDSERQVGITWWMRLKALVNKSSRQELETKKQQTISDAKVLLSNRRNRYKQQTEIRNDERQRLVDILERSEPTEVENYFLFVLESDHYSVDGVYFYEVIVSQLQYIPESRELFFEYRVPSIEELPELYDFDFDKKTNEWVCKGVHKQKTLKRRVNTARAVLIRAISSVFMADEFNNIDRVTVKGLMCYDDMVYERNAIKTVMEVSAVKNKFKHRYHVDELEQLFREELQAKESAGLYNAEPFKLNEPKPSMRKNKSVHSGVVIKDKN